MANIANYQFDDIQKYDLIVSCADPISDELMARIDADYRSDISANAAALMGAPDGSRGVPQVWGGRTR